MFSGGASSASPTSTAVKATPATIGKIEPGFLGVSLDNLPQVGQRGLSLPSRAQFGTIAGTILGPPKDISRQAQYG